ncbi:hypothetical protein BDV93DRAFT_514322 [Ceratobasidium sp. AG-I]|nr:hypothetical protein BDV93DRAFT_514322 [Ceratobasidium sp. AG-I]
MTIGVVRYRAFVNDPFGEAECSSGSESVILVGRAEQSGVDRRTVAVLLNHNASGCRRERHKLGDSKRESHRATEIASVKAAYQSVPENPTPITSASHADRRCVVRVTLVLSAPLESTGDVSCYSQGRFRASLGFARAMAGARRRYFRAI